MPKELLLYGPVYDYVVASLIREMSDVADGVKMRVNSPGGDVYSGWGAIARFAEIEGEKLVQVDGRAASMAAMFCVYADAVNCLDVSTFMFHRAAYASWVENDPEYFTEDMRKSLAATNKKLRAAMEAKMPAALWEQVTGVSYDDLFSLDSRIDVEIDAKQAKKLGLVQKVTAITPKIRAEQEALEASYVMAAFHQKPAAPEATKTEHVKTEIMTAAEIKAQYPAAYAEIANAESAKAIEAERDRAGAFLAFINIDPEAVAKGIESGKPMTHTILAQLTLKAASTGKLSQLAADSQGPLQTGEPKDERQSEATEEQKNLQAFNDEVAKLSRLAGNTVK